MSGMDRVSSRKLHLSEESGKVYDKANALFDEVSNEITSLLAQEYLETGKIDPAESVTAFLMKRGAKGFDANTNEESEKVVATEDNDNHIFLCSFLVDEESVVARFMIEKIKDATASPAAAPTVVAETVDNPVQSLRTGAR